MQGFRVLSQKVDKKSKIDFDVRMYTTSPDKAGLSSLISLHGLPSHSIIIEPQRNHLFLISIGASDVANALYLLLVNQVEPPLVHLITVTIIKSFLFLISLPALNVSYRRYIVMLISCDFQNIVEISLSHFFYHITRYF